MKDESRQSRLETRSQRLDFREKCIEQRLHFSHPADTAHATLAG